MRKSFFVLLICLLMLGLAACGATAEDPHEEMAEQVTSDASPLPDDDTGAAQTPSTDGAHVLVAYFSWADNAISTEEVDAVTSPSVVAPGNVQALAGWVQQETGGDLFSIRVTEPYPSDWDECLARANDERGEDARPELEENVADLDRYDTVFLGYPNWWYGVPMALLSFLEENDLSGKTVYLFCSHGSGGLANSVEMISEAVPDAVISESIFDCYEEDTASSQSDIQNWVRSLGY